MVKKDLLMNRIRRSLITTLAATSLLLCTTLALPSGADAASTTNQILLNDHWTGKANIEYGWGTGSDIYLVGDWDGNGQDSLAIRRQNVYHIRNKLSGGVAERTVSYGRPADSVLVGDWDGDGKDTIAVRRGNQYFINNALTSGAASKVVSFGRPADSVLVGDWDGDGKDTIAVRRGNQYFINDSMVSGPASRTLSYGKATDKVFVGDWDGNGSDSFAVRRNNTYYIRNSISSGVANRVLAYGRADDETLVGDWNGDGTDTLGVVRRPKPVTPSPTPPMVYGTLRAGQEAEFVVKGTYTRKEIARAPKLELWITSSSSIRDRWPWAIPGTAGLQGEILHFPANQYSSMMSKLDKWEGYTPGKNPNSMNYTRNLVASDHGNVYVYVATPWRQQFARSYGIRVLSGDFTRY